MRLIFEVRSIQGQRGLMELPVSRRKIEDANPLYCLTDMHTNLIVYRLSVCFSLYLTVSSLYLPQMKPNQARRSRNLPVSISMDTRAQRSSSHGHSGTSWNRRGMAMSRFSSVMTRHASKHKTDQNFIDKMFKTFDLNDNRTIDRREFKLVMQILGIVSHF